MAFQCLGLRLLYLGLVWFPSQGHLMDHHAQCWKEKAAPMGETFWKFHTEFHPWTH